MVCRSGHLTEQDFTAHLGDVYGIGFYMEGGPLAVTDFRADGIARGLEQGQGGGNSSTGSGTDGSGSGGTGSTGSGTGSDAPPNGCPVRCASGDAGSGGGSRDGVPSQIQAGAR